MAWAYTGDPATSPKDELRFILQDTDPSFPLLSDEEIGYLLDTWMPRFDSVTFVASIGAAAVSRKFAGIVSVSADGIVVNTADLAQRYRDLAHDLRDEYKSATIGAEIDIANLLMGYEVDHSIKPLRFGVGLHDNPEAGLQDFGGWTYDPFQLAQLGYLP